MMIIVQNSIDQMALPFNVSFPSQDLLNDIELFGEDDWFSLGTFKFGPEHTGDTFTVPSQQYDGFTLIIQAAQQSTAFLLGDYRFHNYLSEKPIDEMSWYFRYEPQEIPLPGTVSLVAIGVITLLFKLGRSHD